MTLTKEEKKWIDNHPELSSREVSRHLWDTSTLKNKVLRYRRKTEIKEARKLKAGPKILVLDIETTPIMAQVWKIWKENVGLNQIAKDWAVLSFAAKWLGDSVVTYADTSEQDDLEDDSIILRHVWEMLDEADMVIAHNGKGFDFKKLNARFVTHGFKPPSSYKKIDTLEIARRHFGFTSNRLAYLTSILCTEHVKDEHKKYPGFELWKACLQGDKEAFKEMREYNIVDVLSLEEMFFKLAPWTDKIPNLDVYYPDNHVKHCICGSTEFEHDGYYYTNVSVFKKLRCVDCGSEKRERTSVLSAEKRKSLTTTVAQ